MEKLCKYSWLLLDADDTILAYDQAEAQALKNVFHYYQIPFDREVNDLYQEINRGFWRRLEKGGISLENLRSQRFADLFNELGIDLDAVKFSHDYLMLLGQEAPLLPDVWDTLQQLKSHFRLALITNGITSVQRSRLAVSRLDSFFEHVFISEEIGYFKPAVEFFKFVHTAIGEPKKEEILVIGDSLSSDIAGGVRFGLDTCWVNPTGKEAPEALKPTFEIAKLAELVPILIGNQENR